MNGARRAVGSMTATFVFFEMAQTAFCRLCAIDGRKAGVCSKTAAVSKPPDNPRPNKLSPGSLGPKEAKAAVVHSPIDAARQSAIDAQFGAASAWTMQQSMVDEADAYVRLIFSSVAAGDFQSTAKSARRLKVLAARWAAVRLAETASALESRSLTIEDANMAVDDVAKAVAALRVHLRQQGAATRGRRIVLTGPSG